MKSVLYLKSISPTLSAARSMPTQRDRGLRRQCRTQHRFDEEVVFLRRNP